MPYEGFWVEIILFDEAVDGLFQFFGRNGSRERPSRDQDWKESSRDGGCDLNA